MIGNLKLECFEKYFKSISVFFPANNFLTLFHVDKYTGGFKQTFGYLDKVFAKTSFSHITMFSVCFSCLLASVLVTASVQLFYSSLYTK